MGYESKLIIVEHIEGCEYGQTIAEFDLCKLGDFPIKELFPNIFEGYIYIDDEQRTTDFYGDELRYTTNLRELANYLEASNEKEPYRRLMPCVSLLRGFTKSEWNTLKVIHFGH